MRYCIVKDAQGYCLSITHTNSPLDIYELDLSKYDLTNDRIHAYKVGKDSLIFDSVRYNEIQKQKEKDADIKEMSELQKKLDNSDYIMAQTTEGLLDCTTLVQFIKVFNQIKDKYKDTVANRKIWRNRIQEIKKKWEIKL